MRVHAFSGLDGSRLGAFECSSLSWSDSINEDGSISASSDSAIPSGIMPYKTVIAAIDDVGVRHAGYVTKVSTDETTGVSTVSGGGGLTILQKRLVLNRRLKSSWRDGTVLVDDDNPPGDWVLSLKGSYRDIVRGLIDEAMAWGALPFTLPGIEGGSHERTYNCWDMATVADRILDIGGLQDGPEIRLDPVVSDGAISFALNVQDEIVDTVWRWNPRLPGQGVSLLDTDLDGADMCTQCFGVGGRESDELLVAMSSGGSLEALGWPVLQAANTSHSTISVLKTLQSYVSSDVDSGDDPQDCRSLSVPSELNVRVGDWADIRGIGQCKVTDVSYASSSPDRIKVSVRKRRGDG